MPDCRTSFHMGEGAAHLSPREPFGVVSLILFYFLIHASPVYALISLSANLGLELPSQYGVHREVRATEHHLSHVVETVPGQLALLLGKRFDNVAPDYV